MRKRGSSQKPGKLRILHNPDGVMRAVQFKILKLILEKIEVPDYIFAFEIGRSIPDMAAQHVDKKVVVSLDIQNFFPSIKQVHLNALFKNIGFGEKAATTLSELCTYKSFVPQGALTSPKLSNIVTMMTFAPAVQEYCTSMGYTLSIYADDLVISSTESMDGLEGRGTIPHLIEVVRRAIGKFGFRLNKDKIKIMYPHQRQWVCGAVVNRKVNMRRSERNTLRAIVHNSGKNGLEVEASKNGVTTDQFTSKIMGRLNWFAQLNPEAGNAMKDIFKQVASDPIMYPSAETVDVKTNAPLDSLLPGGITDPSAVLIVQDVVSPPW
jgi:RNA-directed DNA polymerase